MDSDRQRVRRQVRRTERRLRGARVLAVLPATVSWSLAVVTVAIAARKLFADQVSEPFAMTVIGGVIVVSLLLVAIVWFRPLRGFAAAMILERHHEYQGRLSNALAFEAEVNTQTSPLGPWREAAIRDAYRRVESLDPKAAVPLHLPKELGVSLLLALVVGCLSQFQVVQQQLYVAEAMLSGVQLDAVELGEDDLEALRKAGEQLARESQDESLKRAAKSFNRIVERLANRTLSRTEAFRELASLERSLGVDAKQERKQLDDALKQMGKSLNKASMSREVAKALEAGQLAEAEKQMRALASKIGRNEAVSKRDIKRLKQALEQASRERQEARKRLEEQRAELRKQLLKQKKALQKERADSPERRLLKKKRRRLERLDRKAAQQERVKRRLSRLDRQLAKAAEALMKDLGLSQEELERAAEDLNRIRKKRMTDEDKQRLRRRLEQLRQMIRQQGRGSKRRLQRLRRFGQRARGQKRQRGGRPQGGGSKPGKRGGQGPLVLGPGGEAIPVPMPGAGSSRGGRENGAEGSRPSGAGKGPGGALKGAATDLAGKTVDVRAEAVDSGQGRTNAQSIRAAASEGFASRSYKRVYRRYRTVAEEHVAKETIPDGKRAYIRRYFQLIRPRE